MEKVMPIIKEIHNESDKLLYIAWILKLSDDVFDKGKDYAISADRSFKILWDLFKKIDHFTIVTEDYYVDRIYRDSYYFYYSCKHFNYNRYCKRIFLFEGYFSDEFSDIDVNILENRFIGSIVIRPIVNRSIGRTLLSPEFFLDKHPSYIRLTDYSVTVYGKRLRVRAFPYSMQDGETTSCAEVTILNLLDYYSQTYPEYYYLLPSDINRIAEFNSYERRLPTIGLRYELISKIFSEAGFHPRLYSTEKMPNYKFKRLMHYYIESGIPVALGLKVDSENKHSVICIGHGPINKSIITKRVNAVSVSNSQTLWVCDVADCIEDYCIMDDNYSPYTMCKCEEYQVNNDKRCNILSLHGLEAEYLMVPLYKRMFLEAADAYDICTSILANYEIGIGMYDERIGKKDNPLVIRLFMASSRTLKKVRAEQFQNDNKELRDYYSEAIFPKFVWVCEIYDVSHYMEKSVIGEIIVDATASPEAKVDGAIIINYPYKICVRTPNSLQDEFLFEQLDNWNSFLPYNGNLTPFEKDNLSGKKK